MPQPFCNVEFVSLGAHPVVARRAKIIRAEGEHEMLSLRFRDRDLSSKNYRTGMPIYVSWGVFPRYREEFFGYTHFAEPSIDEDRTRPTPEIEVLAVGATRVFRDVSPEVWTGTRSDVVIRDLAGRSRLGADVDRGRFDYNALSHDGTSAWEFLRQLAKDEGRHLSAHGTRVNFWNLPARLRGLEKVAPVFSRARNEVRRFRPVVNETGPKREIPEHVAHSLSLDGTESGFSDWMLPGSKSHSDRWTAEPQNRQVLSKVAENVNEARDIVEVEKENARRVYTAKAEVAAYPRLRSGDPVVFEGYGARQSGYWIADQVEITLDSDSIHTELEVSRALTRDNGRRPETPGGKSWYRRPPSVALINGRWVHRGDA